jgi:hypothetical protein
MQNSYDLNLVQSDAIEHHVSLYWPEANVWMYIGSGPTGFGE